MTNHSSIPFGHTIPAHRAFGWCAHCPDRTAAEELAAWQTREPADVFPVPAAEVERLRTENERMRHELEVMYGGAFDSPKAAPADQTADGIRDQLLHAIDHAYTTGVLGYGTPEELLAAYDTSRTPQPADRAALRDRIADALADAEGWQWAPGFNKSQSPTYQGYLRQADAVLAVLPEPADRAAVLREAADQYAKLADQNEAYDREQGQLDETARLQHETVRDVVTGLRRMADETATTDIEASLADGPVRCPLCPIPLTLHTPSGARAHFTTVHPEQRITGRESGPWPLLVADETATTETTDQPHAADSDRVVAYHSLGGRILRCLNHIPPEPEDDFVPVTAEDLPDGGLCTYPECGVDVLIPEPAAGARQDEPTALGLLPLLTSPEPCRWDGPVCTTHSWRSDIGRCPHAQAQALLGGDPR